MTRIAALLLAASIPALSGCTDASASPLRLAREAAMAIRDNPNGAWESQTGVPVFLGVIASADSSTPKNNHDTATPFTNTGDALKGKMLLLQPDAAGYLLPGTTNAATVTTANGVKLAADERVIMFMDDTRGWVAFRSAAAAAANLRIWELR